MDIKAKIEEIIAKIKENPDLLKSLTSDPVGTVKDILGIDLSGEQISSVINGIKEKINLDDIAGSLGDKVKDFIGDSGDLGDKLKDFVGNAGGIGDKVKDIVGNAGGLGETVKNLLGGAEEEVKDAANEAKDAAEDVKEAAENAGDNIGEKIIDSLGGIGEKLSGLFKKD